MKLQNAERAGYIEDVMELYEAAFPEDEKKPFDYMMSLVREGKMEILAIEEDGTFAGLCITVAGGNDTFILDYFAVSKERRSAGIGGRALKLLLDNYRDKKLIFEIEKPDPAADNAVDRDRRKSFYLRNGVKETGVFANVYNTDFELLTNDGNLNYEEYVDALRSCFGEENLKRLNPFELL